MIKLTTHLVYSLAILAVLMLACSKAETAKKQEVANHAEEKVVEPPKIYLEIDIEQLSEAKKGSVIPCILEDGTKYELKIARMEETMPGIISISGDIDNKETGQALFILRDGKLAGIVNMFKDEVSYKLAFDEDSERHYLSLINPENRDVLPGSEPVNSNTQKD